jgi:hypothetical protein
MTRAAALEWLPVRNDEFKNLYRSLTSLDPQGDHDRIQVGNIS